MSYDIRIGVKIEGYNDYAVIAEPEYASPTYNLREMFVACMNWDYEQGEWYKVSDVYEKIKRGVYELTFNEKAYRKYNPDNGWGDTESALEALKSLLDCIDSIEDPDSWEGWNTIPKAYLYMRW